MEGRGGRAFELEAGWRFTSLSKEAGGKSGLVLTQQWLADISSPVQNGSTDQMSPTF